MRSGRSRLSLPALSAAPESSFASDWRLSWIEGPLPLSGDAFASCPCCGGACVNLQTDPKHCEQVRPLLDRAFKAQPNHWKSFWVQANCYAMRGEKENADASYRRAVENAPMPDSNLLFSWGRTLETLGKHDAALDAYRRAALIDPDDEAIQRRFAALVSRQ